MATKTEIIFIATLVVVIIAAVLIKMNPRTVSNEQKQKEVSDYTAEFFREHVTYKYDNQTDLCFAFYYGYERAGFANVECTNKVKEQLVNPPK